ncbi:hypothetical protein vseg_005747 [Gypsophila vaccaria]
MFDDAITLTSFLWSSITTWFTPTFLFLFLNLMIGTIFITSSSSFNSSPKPHQPDSTVDHLPHQPPSPLTRAPSLLHRLKSINFASYTAYTSAAAPQQAQQQQQQNGSYTSYTAAAPQQTQQQQQQQNLPSASNPFHESSPQLRLSKKVPARAKTRRASAELKLSRVSAQLTTHTQNVMAPVIEEDITFDEEGPTLDEIYSRIKGTAPHHHHNRQNSDTVPANGEITMKLPAKMKKSASDKSAFNHFEADLSTGNPDSLTASDIEEITAAMAATAGGGTEVDAMADDFINRFKKELQLQRIESIVRYKDMITRGSEQ